jgi:hypothetical protein
MSKILIAKIVMLCSNSTYTSLQKMECASFMGNCVADYEEKTAFKECNVKWKKVESEIK